MGSTFARRDEPISQLANIALRGPILMDPALSISSSSWQYFSGLSTSVFVPATWRELLSKSDVDLIARVLRDLTWTFPGKYESLPEVGRGPSLQSMPWIRRMEPFYLPRDTSDALLSEYPEQWDLENPTDAILSEILTFLTTHSAVATKNRRVLYALRNKGIAVWDATGRVLKSKHDIMDRYPQTKFILFLLLSSKEIYPQGLSSMPSSVSSLLALGAGAILAIDPW